MVLISRINVGLFCLVLVCVGCTRVEQAVVTPNMADQGIVKLDSNPNGNSIDVGLDNSPLSLGSVFVYDNPVEQWEVIGSDKYNLFWRGPQGATKLTTLSTILPDLRWDGGNRSGRRVITEVQGFLHPLKIGNKMSFHEEAIHGSPPGTFSGEWFCEVQNRTEVTVPAGTFDTWQVLCKLNGLEYRLANYSEQLGYNVRMIHVTDDNQATVRQLVASSLLKDADKPAERKSK